MELRNKWIAEYGDDHQASRGEFYLLLFFVICTSLNCVALDFHCIVVAMQCIKK